MPTTPGTPAVRELARRLRPNHRITAMSGAGVSAASGIPTFRGPGGMWGAHRAEDLATPEGFARDPVLVWKWYDWRRQQVAAARPNPAHDVLAGWSRSWDHFTLITQNVDGLHERAGARDVVRFHGSIWELRCWNTCTSRGDPWWDETSQLEVLPPRCPRCGGLARPGVVWFGEGIDDSVIRRSREATRCDVFLTVGTSALVYPAASLVHEAKRRGAFTAEINLESTPASGLVDLSLRGPAEEILIEIEAARERLYPPAQW